MKQPSGRALRRVCLRLKNGFRDLLFPPVCVACGERLRPFDELEPILCPSCQSAFDRARKRQGDRTILYRPADTPADPAGAPAPFARISLVPYRPGHTHGVPERLIYAVKHRDDRRMFRTIAFWLGVPLGRVLSGTGGDEVLFTYPPRRLSAVRKDGFDQAARLAKSLSEICGGQALKLIHRRAHTNHAQKQLNAADRRTHAEAAYELNPRLAPQIKGRIVVLTDDVITTGATMDACAACLYRAGARDVIYVSVAATETRKGEIHHD